MAEVHTAADAQAWFLEFATRLTDRDPLYSRLGMVFADDPDLAALLLVARPTQRNPPLVYAAIHDLLLAGVDHPLASHYPTVVDTPSTDDPESALRDFLATHHDAITERIATRATQTNSIERSTVLLALVARIGDEVGALAHVDVGTSGGGNLLLDHWTHHYDVDGVVTTVAGPLAVAPAVDLATAVTGPAPIPTRMPTIAWRRGLDQSPVDPRDPDAVRWLLACVWPSDLPRFHRLRRALQVVATERPKVTTGDAVDDLPAVLADVPDHLHPVLTTSWVLNYLPTSRQADLLSVLDQIGARRDLSLVTFESPRRTPGMVVPPGFGDTDDTLLGWYRWRAGRRTVQHLATAHAHGRWLDWWPQPIG